jgi:mRNA interferase HigB
VATVRQYRTLIRPALQKSPCPGAVTSAARLAAPIRPRLRPIWAHANFKGMRIIARRTLKEFVERRRGHKDHWALKAAVDAWFDEVRKARRSSTSDVKRSYATASIVSADRIVFNIKGNDYRLVIAVDFEKSIVWIKWIGTHKDYDKIDVKEVQHGG